MSMPRQEYIANAKKLKRVISKVLGIEIKHSQALEIVAQAENYPSWDALSGQFCTIQVPVIESVDNGKVFVDFENQIAQEIRKATTNQQPIWIKTIRRLNPSSIYFRGNPDQHQTNILVEFRVSGCMVEQVNTDYSIFKLTKGEVDLIKGKSPKPGQHE